MIPIIDQARILYVEGTIVKSHFGFLDIVVGTPYMSGKQIVVDCKIG